MRRLKIGIRPQLIMLVAFSSLFSLLIFAVVAGVYFSSNLTDLRAERLVVISELRATQVKQALDYIYYQVIGLALQDTIANSLSSYRAGNNSNVIFTNAQTSLDQFISNSELFISARLYNLDLAIMAQSNNNDVTIAEPTKAFLYPLVQNATVPTPLLNLSPNTYNEQVYITGPIANSSDIDGPYFMGMTVPVYANSSIILTQPTLAGYLSILVNATNIQQAANDSSISSSNSYESKDYSVILVQPIYGSTTQGVDNQSPNSSFNNSAIIGFKTIFPTVDSGLNPNEIYNINSSSAIKNALLKTSQGSATNLRSLNGEPVAIGFSSIQIDTTRVWTLIIQQPRSRFLEPIDQFAKIIIGVVIGIGVFMCLITFPLAWYFVKPITQLKEATEAITSSRKKKKPENDEIPPPYFTTKNENDVEKQNLLSEKNDYTDINYNDDNDHANINGTLSPVNRSNDHDKRDLILSGNSDSGNSTAIRLPTRLRNSKKFFKDELTELTEAFNIMTEELEKQYTHLEDRVKLRTKELEASKLEAEKANEAKTVFIANISHELRTPLNGILGMTAIAMDEPDHSRIQDSLKLINRSGELLLHILTELLTYSKNTLKRSKLEKANFQILEVVYQVKSIFSKLAFDSKVNFSVMLKPNILRKLILYGDSNRIIQVVMNLVSNSLKFTPVDGSVDVTFKLLGEYDYFRSRDVNFTKVFVAQNKYNHKLPEVPRSTSPTKQDTRNQFMNNIAEDKMNENTVTNSTTGTIKQPTNKLGPIPFDLENNNNSNDIESMVTISTAEYENTIFRSQFNHTKPLPHSPEFPRFELVEADSEFDSNTNNGKLQSESTATVNCEDLFNDKSENKLNGSYSNGFSSGQRNTDSTARSNSINQKEINDENSTKSESSFMHQKQLNLHHNSNFERRKSNTSMTKQEIVKDGKAYKIRHLYKPKTWVLQIEVKDTGPGIEPALQDKVFEPFIQGDQTLSRSYGGTGLGLSICRQLAVMMNGTLTLKSVIGAGSTFTFTVPLLQRGEIIVDDDDLEDFCDDEFNPDAKYKTKKVRKEHEANTNFVEEEDTCSDYNDNKSKIEESSKSSSDLAPTIEINGSDNHTEFTKSKKKPRKFNLEIPSKASLFEKPHLITRSSTGTAHSSNGSDKDHTDIMKELSDSKILVAEDNLVNQEVIKRMLKLEGFENITIANNGADAVELVKESYDKQEPFDLIFMDVQMPKIDGLLATKMIRKNLRFDKPIIALTAFADESNVKECLNAGMTGFLSKPIRRTNLRQIIAEYSPILLSEIVTTPQTHQSDEKRLGYWSNSNASGQLPPQSPLMVSKHDSPNGKC